MFERVQAIHEVALGVDHPKTITSRASVAGLYMKQGWLERAAPLLEDVLGTRERVQGHGHPDTVAARLHLTRLLCQQVNAVVSVYCFISFL